MRYKVLWLDDEYETFTSFSAMAKRKKIELHPFKVRQDGLNELKLHPYKYDAVLLDAKMPENDINEVTGIKGIKNVINFAHEIHVPVFISTGQPDLKSDLYFKDSFDNIFVKGDATSVFGGDTELFAAMLKQLEHKEESIVKRLYVDVFTALKGLDVVDEGCEILLPILCKMHNPEDHPDFNPIHHYTQLRILIEYLFRVFNKNGILPDAFILDEGKSNNGRRGVNLDLSCKYLQGEKATHIPYQSEKPIFPSQLGFNILAIIRYANTSSHSAQLTDADEKLVADELAKPRSKYTLYTFVMMLCEAILWMYGYIQEHSNYASNQALWIYAEQSNTACKVKVGDIVSLSRDSGNNVYVENAKADYNKFKNISDEDLKERRYMIISIDNNNDSRTKGMYPYFIEIKETPTSL